MDNNFRDDDKIFRFEARWIQHETFEENLFRLWGMARRTYNGDWVKVIEQCGQKLRVWDKEVYRTS